MPVHTHIGTTVFNNFTKKYPHDWQLNQQVAETVKGALTRSGFTPVDLQKEGVSFVDVAGLLQQTESGWKLGAGKEMTFNQMRERLQLKAVVALKESRVRAFMECGGGPCVDRMVEGSGLYSRSMLGMTNYLGVAAYKWNVYALDPLADLTTTASLRNALATPSFPIAGFKKPADFYNISAQEFAPVKDAVLKFVDGSVTEALKPLNPK